VTRLRAVYTDLDGTLLGRGGSLLRDGEGAFTLLGARALEACWRADVEVVPYSGRRRAQLAENCRLLGLTSFVFEVGSGVVLDGETHFLTKMRFGDIEASGAPALLGERFGLADHDPWHLEREVTHLLRGSADVAAADALLRDEGLGHLRLIDNGALRRPGMRAFHLAPREVSKAAGVAAHMRMRGYAAGEVVALGDSPEDAAVAEAVGAFWMIGERTEAPNGPGVYEAVLTELAERR